MASMEGNLEADIEKGLSNPISYEGKRVLTRSCSYGQKPGIEYRDILHPNSSKHLKPPRPPKGPSLSSSDMRLVKEISDHVAMKRARIEHMKALKKMKATKTPSSSSFTTMFVIVIFCIIVILRGIVS